MLGSRLYWLAPCDKKKQRHEVPRRRGSRMRPAALILRSDRVVVLQGGFTTYYTAIHYRIMENTKGLKDVYRNQIHQFPAKTLGG
jgi:hypothetical protein